jgi:hypothetical protein
MEGGREGGRDEEGEREGEGGRIPVHGIAISANLYSVRSGGHSKAGIHCGLIRAA